MQSDAPYKTIEDVRSAKEPPKCGTTGTSNMGYFVPKLLEETVGVKFAVVAGYPGGSEVDLAVERNEVQCRSLGAEAFFPANRSSPGVKTILFECWCTGLRNRQPQ